MESTPRTQPNTFLRRQRLLRGWSLRHVVEQLCSLCDEEKDVPGVTKDMVSKWERGERNRAASIKQSCAYFMARPPTDSAF